MGFPSNHNLISHEDANRQCRDSIDYFHRTQGISEGVQKKVVDQSVMMTEMDNSIQLTDFQPVSDRRQTAKLVENQSDEPAEQSDEDKGEEMDIEELKIDDIAINGQKKQRRAQQPPSSSQQNSQ